MMSVCRRSDVYRVVRPGISGTFMEQQQATILGSCTRTRECTRYRQRATYASSRAYNVSHLMAARDPPPFRRHRGRLAKYGTDFPSTFSDVKNHAAGGGGIRPHSVDLAWFLALEKVFFTVESLKHRILVEFITHVLWISSSERCLRTRVIERVSGFSFSRLLVFYYVDETGAPVRYDTTHMDPTALLLRIQHVQEYVNAVIVPLRKSNKRRCKLKAVSGYYPRRVSRKPE